MRTRDIAAVAGIAANLAVLIQANIAHPALRVMAMPITP